MQISITYGVTVVLFLDCAFKAVLDAEERPENTSFAKLVVDFGAEFLIYSSDSVFEADVFDEVAGSERAFLRVNEFTDYLDSFKAE